MQYKLFVGILFLLLVLPVAFAACPVTMTARNTQALFLELPTLHADLQACPTAIPASMSRLVGSGNVVLNIGMTDGSSKSILVLTNNGQVTGVQAGTGSARWSASIAEGTLDSVLASQTRGAALSQAFSQGRLTIRANSFFRGIGWFFTKPFVLRAVNKNLQANPPQARPAPPGIQYTPGRPDGCDETWIPGHRQYAQNKEKWDGYTAATDGACQQNRGIPSGCVYSVQLSTDTGIPYYLCWYKLT